MSRLYVPALDERDHFLDPAAAGVAEVHHLDLPALPLGVPGIHPEEIAGEQRRLVSTGARPDFEDHVLLVVRILRDQQHLDLVEQPIALDGQRGELLLRQLPHVGILQELLGGVDLPMTSL